MSVYLLAEMDGATNEQYFVELDLSDHDWIFSKEVWKEINSKTGYDLDQYRICTIENKKIKNIIHVIDDFILNLGDGYSEIREIYYKKTMNEAFENIKKVSEDKIKMEFIKIRDFLIFCDISNFDIRFMGD